MSNAQAVRIDNGAFPVSYPDGAPMMVGDPVYFSREGDNWVQAVRPGLFRVLGGFTNRGQRHATNGFQLMSLENPLRQVEVQMTIMPESDRTVRTPAEVDIRLVTEKPVPDNLGAGIHAGDMVLHSGEEGASVGVVDFVGFTAPKRGSKGKPGVAVQIDGEVLLQDGRQYGDRFMPVTVLGGFRYVTDTEPYRVGDTVAWVDRAPKPGTGSAVFLGDVVAGEDGPPVVVNTRWNPWTVQSWRRMDLGVPESPQEVGMVVVGSLPGQ